MGIPGLFGRWLTKNAAKSVVNGIPKYCSSLSIDMNGMIHDSRGEVFGETNEKGFKGSPNDIKRIKDELSKLPEHQLWHRIFSKLEQKILSAVKAFNPKDTLILAVDGIAPGAKIQQQRSRREKSASVPNSGPFDRNCITPGTEFMINLDTYIRNFLNISRLILPPTIIYSSHLEPGEGEHKIMEYYRKGKTSNTYHSRKGAAHILHGLDADLIMLGLLSPQNKIYLSRQTVRYSLDIDILKRELEFLGISVDNFVIAVMLIGNDFLPQCPSLEAMEKSINFLIKTCVEFDLKLYREDEIGINWKDMIKFIEIIASQESQNLYDIQRRLISEKTLNTNKFLSAATKGTDFYPNDFRSVWYENEIFPKFSENVELSEVFKILAVNIEENQYLEKSTNMFKSFAVTLEWVYLYYKKGTMAVNHDWSYMYFHSPMFSDLFEVLSEKFTEIKPYSETGNGIMWDFKARPDMNVFNALEQLVSVIPLNSKAILPKELLPLYGIDSIIRDLFPKTFITEKDGKLHDHEAIAIVPFIDRKRIIVAVLTLEISPNIMKKWEGKGDLILIEETRLLPGRQRVPMKNKSLSKNKF